MASALEATCQQAKARFGAVIVWGYFKPLRRKLGLVTLAMACVCAVGFVRSGVKRDTLFARLLGSQVIMISSAGKLHIWMEVVSRQEKQLRADVVFQVDFDQQFLRRGTLNLPVAKSSRSPSYRWSSANGPMKTPIDENAWTSLWKWQFTDFECQAAHFKNVSNLKFYSLVAPYWSLILSLTLISAYLLLSKPCTRKPKPASEP